MPNVATSVRIPADATDVLCSLANKLGQSKAQVVEIALKDLHERLFWADVRESFERSAVQDRENVRQTEEMRVWERVSEADFKDEKW